MTPTHTQPKASEGRNNKGFTLAEHILVWVCLIYSKIQLNITGIWIIVYYTVDSSENKATVNMQEGTENQSNIQPNTEPDGTEYEE